MEYTLIDNFDDIKELKLDPNSQYLCLMECFDGAKMSWRAVVAYFYEKGDVLTLHDNDNGVHRYDIPENGFYYVTQLPGGHGDDAGCMKLNKVRYYKKIDYPDTEPDSFLEIEK